MDRHFQVDKIRYQCRGIKTGAGLLKDEFGVVLRK